MDRSIIEVGEGFWNIRGSFRIGGIVDIGTHCSLLRLESGRFVLLDACDISAAVHDDIKAITGGPDAIEALLHLHPFHTMYVEQAHRLFPGARLFGTKRHHRLAPELPWQAEHSNEATCHQQFGPGLDFSVPRGVAFIHDNENVHFSSVLAYHRASKTIHVDDTFNFIRAAGPLSRLGLLDAVRLHPTLAQALEPRKGAAQDFRRWCAGLIEAWNDAENLCAAHTGAWLARDWPRHSLPSLLSAALESAESTLLKHEQRHG
ncbi:MAG: hypothetical protein R3348_02625 [Xanthomonadales bacterium]|nr:hypothetical protein [Xanthomonadales bacterium]